MDIDYSEISRSIRRLGRAAGDVSAAAQVGEPDTGTTNRGLARVPRAATDCADLIDTLRDRVQGLLFAADRTDEGTAGEWRDLACRLGSDPTAGG